MPIRRTAGSVLAGATVTLACPFPVVVLFLLFGLLTGGLVGASLPMWAVGLPLLACPILGGLTAALLRPGSWSTSLVVGCLAGGLGAVAAGIVAGVALGILAMGMMPYQGQTVDVSRVLVRYGLYGAGTAAVVGTVLGGAGGGIAAVARRWRETDADG